MASFADKPGALKILKINIILFPAHVISQQFTENVTFEQMIN